jgi:uncharacterized protein HemX
VRENERVLTLTKQITSIQAQLASTQKLLTTVDADVTSTDDVFTQKLTAFSKVNDKNLNRVHADLNQSIANVQRQLGKTRGDWLMADAEYLLSVANQRLHLVGDLKTTIEALKAADQRLHESGDGAAFKIREQIAKEIAVLKDVKVNDIVGSYTRVKVLIDKIESLTLLLPYAEKPLKKANELYGQNKKSGDKDSAGMVDMVLKQLDGYVTVRQSEAIIEKVLTLEQAKLIQQQLSIMLEMIKIALVQENTALYETSMNDALQWLALHFTVNKVSKNFTDELEALKKAYINTEMPDISLSLKMLRDITKLRIETDKALVTHNPTKDITADEVTKKEIMPSNENKPADIISSQDKNTEKNKAPEKGEAIEKPKEVISKETISNAESPATIDLKKENSENKTPLKIKEDSSQKKIETPSAVPSPALKESEPKISPKQ